MAINRPSARRFSVAASALLLMTAAFVGVSGAANASTTTPSSAPAASTDDSCSYDLGTATLVCVAPGQDLDQAVYEQTGLRVQPTGATAPAASAAETPAAAATTYVQADLYKNASYSGTVWQITNSSACNDHTVWALGDLSTRGWTGISSFKSYSNCWSKVWTGGNYTGASYGWDVNVSNLGALNDDVDAITITEDGYNG